MRPNYDTRRAYGSGSRRLGRLRHLALAVSAVTLMSVLGLSSAHATERSLYFAFDMGGAGKLLDEGTFGDTFVGGVVVTAKVGGATKSPLVDWELGVILSAYRVFEERSAADDGWAELAGRLSVNFYLPPRTGAMRPFALLGIELGQACVKDHCAPEGAPPPPDARVDALGFGVVCGVGVEFQAMKTINMRMTASYRGIFWRGATRVHYHNAFTVALGIVVPLWR